MRKLVLGLAAAGLVAGTNASGKDFMGFRLLDLEGTLVRWSANDAEAAVTYAFVDRPMRFEQARNCEGMVPLDGLLSRSRIGQGTLRREARAAFDMWQQAANIRFLETSDVAAAGILIGAQEQPEGRAFANVAQRAGHTGEIERSLICLNPKQPWKVGFDGNLAVYDLRYTIAHEIGHAIGLDHPAPAGQLMSHRYHEQFRALQAGDVSGAVELYGARDDRGRRATADRSAAERTKAGATGAPAPVICSAIGAVNGC